MQIGEFRNNYANILADNRISKLEVQFANASKGKFTKDFLGLTSAAQIEILKTLDMDAKEDLFTSIKSSYDSADNGESKTICSRALMNVAGNIIRSSGARTLEEFIGNILVFMKNHLSNVNGLTPKSPKQANEWQRDASQWSGAQVLAEGNFNGCVEAVKVFLDIYNTATAGTPLPIASYQSSFDLTTAKNSPNIDSYLKQDSVPGHALVKFQGEGKTTYIDATMFESSSYLPDVTKTVSDGKYSMTINNEENKPEVHTFVLFGNGETYHKENNPSYLLDPTTSTGATRIAVKQYFKR